MIAPNARAAAVAGLPFAREISVESRSALQREIGFHQFAAGSGVIEKGQPVSGAYFVVSGLLRVATLTPNGREATLYPLAPGDTCILALNALFNDLLYPAWVRSEAETSVVVVPGPLYRRLFEREAAVRALTVKALSTVVFRLMAELEDVHSRALDERLASFILAHAASDGVLSMTQQAIADHLGTTREVVARLVGDLARRRLIATGRRRIAMLDRAGLVRATARAQ